MEAHKLQEEFSRAEGKKEEEQKPQEEGEQKPQEEEEEKKEGEEGD
jgi:hypothetical protein